MRSIKLPWRLLAEAEWMDAHVAQYDGRCTFYTKKK
jgi:hypothetical protein